ncbi:MAG: aldehyde dehydrogenase family protein [bacterium]
MKEYGLWIDGGFREAHGGRTTSTFNPATEEPWAKVAVASADDVDAAVAAAKRAHASGVWRSKSREERGAILQGIATAIFEKQDELALAEVQDGGGTIRKATMADIPAAAQGFLYYGQLVAGTSNEEEFDESIPVTSRNLVRKEPIGVVAGITPWNFPLMTAAWKIAPAIAAGNTIVLKPASNTPVTALMLAELCSQCGVPDGVVNVVSGPGASIGEHLAGHPDVGKVSLTGSTEVGRRILELAARDIKKVTLELGGKSANIVLEDADLDCAARGALFGTFLHQGQACESGTRVLVPRSIYDAFVARMVELAGELTVGDTLDPTTCIGPVISEKQRATVERYVEIGREEGALVATGGRRPAHLVKGYYYEPTILANVDNDWKVAQEEIFGPVVVVIPFDDDAHAVRIANQSCYGLAGAVWSRNVERALAIARALETGTVWINDYHLTNVRFPFGGYKRSGIGRELGPMGLDIYQETKHIHVGEPTDAATKFYFGMLFNS